VEYQNRQNLSRIDYEIREIKNPFRKALAIVLIAGIVVAFLSLITKPLRGKWAENYVAKGDEYLLSKQYLHARLEYEKSNLVRKNVKAKDRITLAQSGSADIRKLEGFFNDNQSDLYYTVKNAETPGTSASAQTALAKSLIEREEYQISVIAATTAVAMDPSFRDAWLYLGIANLKCGQLLEIDNDTQKTYLNNAKTALAKAKEIDPEYQVTDAYLREL